jgi:DNA-binding NarL/FixJ family response regulator
MEANVLIVEDQALIAFHLQALVEEAGHRAVAIAHDPGEATAAAATRPVDFALMDIRLAAGTSGVEAARMLYEGWEVRSIFLSANLDAGTRAAVEPCRPLGFIGKPFLPSEVIAAVRRAAAQIAVGKKRMGSDW